jgi:hypothetical protein
MNDIQHHAPYKDMCPLNYKFPSLTVTYKDICPLNYSFPSLTVTYKDMCPLYYNCPSLTVTRSAASNIVAFIYLADVESHAPNHLRPLLTADANLPPTNFQVEVDMGWGPQFGVFGHPRKEDKKINHNSQVLTENCCLLRPTSEKIDLPWHS